MKYCTVAFFLDVFMRPVQSQNYMKTAMFVLLLLGVQQVLLAQGDMGFNIYFSPLSSPPGTNQLSGHATYFPDGWGTGAISVPTNSLAVSINLGPNQATDGWILQQEGDGSLTPVLELTNELYVADYPFPGTPLGTYPAYVYSDNYQLTPNQIQNLLAGDWYTEIDYGGNTYLGNLTPVPEPETLALLGLGLVAICLLRKK